MVALDAQNPLSRGQGWVQKLATDFAGRSSWNQLPYCFPIGGLGSCVLGDLHPSTYSNQMGKVPLKGDERKKHSRVHVRYS